MGWGCREAQTPTGPGGKGPDETPPLVTTDPGRDTTVDSVGVLNIVVSVHDRTLIDTVALEIFGAPLAFPPQVVNDTVYTAIYQVGLGALNHQPFVFRVTAGDALGHDTTTDSVHVRLR